MGRPRLRPEEIPFIAPVQAQRYSIALDQAELQIGAVSMGNPHAVLQVASVDQAPIAEWGPLLERHERFPQRVNVGFMEVVQRDWIKLRVYERGVGETLACGTGACAAVVAGRLQGQLDEAVRVQLRGGDLTVHWTGNDETVWMTGPAKRVFDGWLEL
jgi:diaminopimelate epimerase